MRHNISIKVDPEFKKLLKTAWLRKLITYVLEDIDISEPVEMGLVIVSNRKIRELNKLYRNKDKCTDILSFSMSPISDIRDISFITAPDGVCHLGEVIISYDQTMMQAKKLGHDIDHELKILIIHGVLHLLGYDHDVPRDRKMMQNLEKRILSALS